MVTVTNNLQIPKPDGLDFVKRAGIPGSIWSMMDAIDANALSAGALNTHRTSQTDHTAFIGLTLYPPITFTGPDVVLAINNTKNSSVSGTSSASEILGTIITGVANASKMAVGFRNYLDITGNSVALQVFTRNDIGTFKTKLFEVSETGANLAPNFSLGGSLTVGTTTTIRGITYTWPAAQTNGFYLMTNGAGGLSWAGVPASIGVAGTSGQALINGGTAAVSSGTATVSLATNGSLPGAWNLFAPNITSGGSWSGSPQITDPRLVGQTAPFAGPANGTVTLPAAGGLAGTWRYFKAWGAALTINCAGGAIMAPPGLYAWVASYTSPNGESTSWYCDGVNWWCY